MSRRIVKRAASVLGALLLLTGAAFAQDGEGSQGQLREEFHQSYPLSPQGRVTLKNITGAVRITAWDRAEVRVDAVKRGESRERLDEAKIVVDANSDSIYIETRYPEEAFRDEAGVKRRRNAASVDYTVSVPRGARLESIEVISGRLDIENVSGGVRASCISGRFTARNLSGEARLSNVSGMLEATFDRLNDASNITLGNVSGQIILNIPSDASGTIKASTLSGHILNNFGLPVRRGEHIGNDLSGQLGQGGGTRIRLNNVSGQIKIQRAADGRTPSAVTNLLSDAHPEREGATQDDIQKQVAREIERAMRDTERAVRDTERMVRDTERVVERTNRAAERANRDAERANRAAPRTREAVQNTERARRSAERAARDLERSQLQIEREVERAAREVERAMEAQEHGVAEHGDAAYRLTERESKSFNVSGRPRVQIKTFDGSINIQPTNEPVVRFTAVKRARDEQSMRGIRLRAEQTGDGVLIIAEFDKTAARNSEHGTGAAVALDVWLPRSANVNVRSGDGRLRLSGIEGEIDLHTGDGSVDVTESKGRLTVETGDGRVRVAGFDGDATVQTGDGRITLDGRFNKLSARTGDGAISLALPEGANARIETDSERVVNDMSAVAEEADTEDGVRRVRHWRVGSGTGGQITLRTGDGQIFLRRTGDERE
ncbi:MAG TPA: DUF4097 family beta strand repeat-containing protein [Pyrinomonadaceae bacterium]|nr:DUF4097 family beta strand repeat-containing protein [Pyrinomonadaceae bacterium]